MPIKDSSPSIIVIGVLINAIGTQHRGASLCLEMWKILLLSVALASVQVRCMSRFGSLLYFCKTKYDCVAGSVLHRRAQRHGTHQACIRQRRDPSQWTVSRNALHDVGSHFHSAEEQPALLSPCPACPAVSSVRIVGGDEAAPGQFPHQVGIWIVLGRSKNFCGGSIISDRIVITAAHCAT